MSERNLLRTGADRICLNARLSARPSYEHRNAVKAAAQLAIDDDRSPTGGRQVLGTLPVEFTALYATNLFGLPIAAFYVLAISVVLWIVSNYLPVGRMLYGSPQLMSPCPRPL